MKRLDRLFLILFMVGTVIAGLGLAFFAPFFAMLLPLAAVPILIYGYARATNEGRMPHLNPLASEKVQKWDRVTASMEARERMEAEEVIDLGIRRENMRSLQTKTEGMDASRGQLARQQIEEINTYEMQKLIDLMPSNATCTHEFNVLSNEKWIFQFHSKATAAEFNAMGVGSQPRIAFEAARKVLNGQVKEWHEVRSRNKTYVGRVNEVDFDGIEEEITQAVANSVANQERPPTVLIIEDDIDVATATAAVFRELGCETIISDGKDGAPQKMSFDNVDFIVLDWVLGENLMADQLIKRSARIINAFKDLQERFRAKMPKIITFSALKRSEVHLPENRYFEHADHWQKPVKYSDLAHRASEMLEANGY